MRKDTGIVKHLPAGKDGQLITTTVSTLDETDSTGSITSSEKQFSGQGLSKGLSTRHVTMITLGNSIGMSLWLGTGKSLVNGGPASLLIGFGICITVVYTVTYAVGEISVAYPMAAPFPQWSNKFIDRAFAITIGFSYWLTFVLNMSGEVVAATTVTRYWDTNYKVPTAALLTIYNVVVFATNLFGVKVFGEIESAEAVIKFMWIFVAIIACIVISAKDNIGFRYWNREPFINGFKGFLVVLQTCSWSVGGAEFLGIISGEARNPYRSIPVGVRSMPLRLTLFYLLGSLMVTITVDPKNPNLFGATGTNASPFVLAFKDGGVPGLADCMNAIILLSVLSAGCAYLYGSSRQLYSMSQLGLAPKIFAKTDKRGRPWYSTGVSMLISVGLSYLNVSNSGSTVFSWFSSLSTLCYFVVWGGIYVCHIQLRRSWKAQGRDLSALPYRSWMGEAGSYYGLVLVIILTINIFYLSVWPLGLSPSAKNFFANFISMVLMIGVYVIAKIWYRGRFLTRPVDANLDLGFREYTTEEINEKPVYTRDSFKFKNIPKTFLDLLFT